MLVPDLGKQTPGTWICDRPFCSCPENTHSNTMKSGRVAEIWGRENVISCKSPSTRPKTEKAEKIKI